MTEIADTSSVGAGSVIAAGRPAAGGSAAGGAQGRGDASDPEGVFSKAMAVSGIRCMLAYVLIPYVFPLVGFGSGLGPWIGVPVGLAAIAANIASIARFWRSGHRWKWPVSTINAGVIVLLAFLVLSDAADLLG